MAHSTHPNVTTAGVEETRRRVVYLVGAGATQGCIDFKGSTVSLLMSGLITPLMEQIKELRTSKPKLFSEPAIVRLVNDVVNEAFDFEQLITFLEDARSATHRHFAAELKGIFSSVLRSRLDDVRSDLDLDHSFLYAALIDMHDVEGNDEDLVGIMSLNYDMFIEHAVEEHLKRAVDYGIQVQDANGSEDPVRLLKLHGSFGWADQWPVTKSQGNAGSLWIPPGIRKAKSEYPFNAIWGLAREMLECDVVRIIGCELGSNDWDLVSLLFTTMHTHASEVPYRIEVIAPQSSADRIADMFPYLEVVSLLNLPTIGAQIVSETKGGPPLEYGSLSPDDQELVRKHAETKLGNPFESWLRLKGEALNTEVEKLDTTTGVFSKFVLNETRASKEKTHEARSGHHED